MSNRYDICSPRAKKDGGTYWVKIGTAWQGDKGIQLVFDALPLPDAEGRCSANLFEPRDNDRRRSADADRSDARQRSQGGGAWGKDDDSVVPF